MFFHWQIVRMAFRGLQQNMLRSLLATLGVIIGVGAVVSAISILEGAKKDIMGKFEALGADQVIVMNGSTRRGGATVNVASLTPEDAEAILEDNPDLVKAVSPQFQNPAQIKYLQKNEVGNILGATESYAAMNSYEVASGRFITREDVRGKSKVCVLGHKLAKDLFTYIDPVGERVKIRGKSFIVGGVMEEKGTLGFVEVDTQAIIPLSTAMGRLFNSRHLSMLIVQARDPKRLTTVIQQVKGTLRGTHRIRPGQEDDFNVFTQEQIKEQVLQVTKIFAVVLNSIAGISMVVGGIGIMNIMLVSVTERTREIGVRIAVGARRFDILKQFLTEASAISIFGGGLGVACGWGIASFLTEITNNIFTSYTPPIIIPAALAMALGVGIVSGIYPAIRAAQLDPVRALRYE